MTGEALALAAKDLRLELRGRHAVSTVLPFAVTLLVALGLALGPDRPLLRQVAPGLLWITVLFAAVLATRRSYELEGEDGALEGLLLSPADPAAIFLGKAAALSVQLLALEVVLVTVMALLFGLPLAAAPVALALVCLLATVGLAAIGSLFGVVAQAARTREGVLPLLVLPAAIPLLVDAVRATSLALEGRDVTGWLGLLLSFDVVALAAGTLLYGYLVED
ncbi:MAG: heme exporter protein [Actinomycetota bacterium]|jgi:heme exporter protein B|nr:heme exporter protein [Actinomycetota bacterium]